MGATNNFSSTSSLILERHKRVSLIVLQMLLKMLVPVLRQQQRLLLQIVGLLEMEQKTVEKLLRVLLVRAQPIVVPTHSTKTLPTVMVLFPLAHNRLFTIAQVEQETWLGQSYQLPQP